MGEVRWGCGNVNQSIISPSLALPSRGRELGERQAMIYWIGTLSVLIAVECVFAGTCLSMFFPPQPSALVHDFFTTYQHGISPKRDVLFFRLFMLVGVAATILLMRFFARRSTQKQGPFKYFTMVQAAIVSTEAFFLFKYALYKYPLWLNGFYVSLILSVVIKIFSPEILKWLQAFNERLKDKTPFSNLSLWLTASGMILIPLIVWVPDVEGAVARMFFGEGLHHIDWLLMSAGWSHMSGNILGVDNISRYGIGAPVIASEIAQRLLGRFDYVNGVKVMMLVSIVYYWIWFYALRLILKDTAWAFIALFLGLRLHFFHMETFPFIFTYPQVTPLRYFFDSLFFIFLIFHTQSGRLFWLYLTAVVSGLAVFSITGEGLYTLATFYVFLFLREVFVIKNPGNLMPRLNKRQWAMLLIVPWLALLSCLWVVVGKHIFEGIFWYNQFEYIRFYQAGNSSAPMMNNLAAPFVDRASIAFLCPAAYLFILVILIGKMMQKTIKVDGLIMACACVFLLISFHYHAMVSNNMPSYLRNGVIIAMGMVFMLKHISTRLGQYQQRLFKLICGTSVLVITVTTHMFLLHPNIFNLARNPMTHPVVSQLPVGRNSYFNHLYISFPEAFKLPVNGLGEKDELMVTENDFTDDRQLRELFRKETDYSTDAALIQSLTTADTEVPLVSSFENLILMQARRRPYFYTYFMVSSQPRRMRKFPVTVIYTKGNLMREINRMEKDKPTYVFVESTYLVSPVPQAYLYDNEDLVDLLEYVFSRYTPYKRGKFLVAMKRRG